jgi:hypothetical protein
MGRIKLFNSNYVLWLSATSTVTLNTVRIKGACFPQPLIVCVTAQGYVVGVGVFRDYLLPSRFEQNWVRLVSERSIVVGMQFEDGSEKLKLEKERSRMRRAVFCGLRGLLLRLRGGFALFSAGDFESCHGLNAVA